MTWYLTVEKVKILSLLLRKFKKCKKIAQNKKCKTEDVTFIKKVPLHLHERMKRNRKVKTEITTPEDTIFIKQVPVHPRDRLKRKRKIKLENYNNLTEKK